MEQEERAAFAAEILDLVDYSSEGFTRANQFLLQPKHGQMVVTGPQPGRTPEAHIGFCVQVRKGCGQFGSDMVFLRHPNGLLVTHENQCFFPMSEAQVALARPLFKHLPEEEDYSEGYRCCDQVHALGFLIENSGSTPLPDSPFQVVIAGPGTEKTFVAFV